MFNKLIILRNLWKTMGYSFVFKLVCLSVPKIFFRSKLRNNFKTIVFLMPSKGIGDGIIFTGLLKAMNNAGYEIYVLSRKDVAFFYEKISFIHGVIKYDLANGISKKEILKQVGIHKFDILIEMYGDTAPIAHRVNSMFALKAKHKIGINGDGILRSCMDYSIEYQELDKHLSNRGNYMLNYLGINTGLPGYQIDLSGKDLSKAQDFLSNISGKFIVAFNPFASNERRSLSIVQVNSIIQMLLSYEDICVIVIGEKHKLATLNINESKRLIINKLESFHEACAVLKLCDFVVTSETSFVHVSNAFAKEMVCIYGSENMEEFDNNINFGPNYPGATQIIHPQKRSVPEIDVKVINDTIKSRIECCMGLK